MNNRLRIIDLLDRMYKLQGCIEIAKKSELYGWLHENRRELALSVSVARNLISQEDVNILLDENCNSLLHKIVYCGSGELLDYLLKNKKLIYNVKNVEGDSPLHIACKLNNTNNNTYFSIIIKLLSINEIDIKVRNKYGYSSLDIAILNHDKKTIKKLLSHQSMTDDFFLKTCTKAIRYDKDKILEFVFNQHIFRLSLSNEVKSKLIKFAWKAIRRGYINIVCKINDFYPNILINEPDLLKFILNDNKEMIKESISFMSIASNRHVPILNIEHAKLFFSAKYNKDRNRKRIAILEKDDDFPNADEFGHFLEKLKIILSDNPLFSTRMQFILTSKHWLAGDIKINKGAISILFIDPLGASYRDAWLDLILKEAMMKVAKLFPHAEIFASVESLQRKDYTSCTVFSIDNASHLYNADYFLTKTSFKGDLHDYLKAHVIEKNDIFFDQQSFSVNLVSLPLRMVRSMQSLNSCPSKENKLKFFTKCGIFERIKTTAYNENNCAVNKREETMLQCVQKNIDDKGKKPLNNRVRAKLDLMRDVTLNYMGNISKEKTLHNMKRFGLEGIIKTLTRDSEKQTSSFNLTLSNKE